MLAKLIARCGDGCGVRFFGDLRGAGLEVILKNVLGGTGLGGDFREAQEKRFGKAAAVDGEHDDGLLFGGTLENDEIEILNAPRQLWPETQNFVELLNALVECGSALEIKLFACAFAIRFNRGAERAAVGIEKLDQAADLDVVILFGAAGKTRSETHFHFRIDATRKRRVAADFYLAATHLEKIERLLGERLRGLARCERAVVMAGGRRAGLIDGDAARGVAARISVAQTDFENGRRTQAHERAVALRENLPGVLIVDERLLEPGAGEPIANGDGEFAEIEAFAGGIGRTEKALKAAAQVLRTNQERLGVFAASFDQTDGGTRGKGSEEIFVARGIEVLAAVEFEHGDRI